MPDFFHVIHEIVKSYSLALGQRCAPAHQALTEAQEALARRQGRPHAASGCPPGQGVGGARQAEVTHWAEVQRTYRHHLETLSLTLHPFRLCGLDSPNLRSGRKPAARRQ